MTYNVFSGTLNLTQSILNQCCHRHHHHVRLLKVDIRNQTWLQTRDTAVCTVPLQHFCDSVTSISACITSEKWRRKLVKNQCCSSKKKKLEHLTLRRSNDKQALQFTPQGRKGRERSRNTWKRIWSKTRGQQASDTADGRRWKWHSTRQRWMGSSGLWPVLHLLACFLSHCWRSEIASCTNTCCLSLANREHSATVLFDQSLISSVHLRLGLPRLLFPSSLPFNISVHRFLALIIWPKYCTVVSRRSWLYFLQHWRICPMCRPAYPQQSSICCHLKTLYSSFVHSLQCPRFTPI